MNRGTAGSLQVKKPLRGWNRSKEKQGGLLEETFEESRLVGRQK